MPQDWQSEYVKEAFRLFLHLLKDRKIEKKNSELYQSYFQTEVREIVEELIEKEANVKLFSTDEAVYLIPNLDNELLSYTNKQLKEAIGLKTNNELYLANFAIMILLSKFYNSEDQYNGYRQYLNIEHFEKSIDEYMLQLGSYNVTELEDLSVEYAMYLEGMVDTWDAMPHFPESLKNIRRGQNNRFSFLLKVLDFLESEDLVMVLDNKEIRLTDKLQTLVQKYYFNSQRKEKVMSLLDSLMPVKTY